MSKKTEESKELVKPAETAVAARPPQEELLGFEGWDASELIIPRLRLLQGLSQAVTDGRGSIGNYENSIDGEITRGPLEVVVLGVANGAIYFVQGEGMKCKSSDGITSFRGESCEACPFGVYHKGEWSDSGKPPACSSTKDVIITTRESLSEGVPMPAILTFSKTSYGIGRKFMSAMRFSGTHIFGVSWIIGSAKDKNDKGIFAVPSFKKGSKLNPEELETAKAFYHTINQVRMDKLKVHDEVSPEDV